MTTISEAGNEIAEDFMMIEDPLDKFGFLIDLGKNLEPLDESLKTSDRLVKGCQASVWLVSALRDGKVYFSADADADYARGLVAMMIRVLSGHTPDEILQADISFLEKIGLSKMLSMKRAGGLESMIRQMKLDALALKAKTV
ncbi:MAG: cysteine desulfuration protein SufE [Bacteroidetes bacterium]|nr:MAG: cysteine desulfuration protein SufE [Bacteroidota bacterium]